MLNNIHEASFDPGTALTYQPFIFSLPSRLLFVLPPFILSDQQPPQPPRQQCHQKHEKAAYSHTLHVIGLITVGIEFRTHQGSELSKEIQHYDAGPSLRVGVLVIDCPCEDECNCGEEACGCGVDTSVSPSRIGSKHTSDCDGEVAKTTEERVEDHVVASIL